MCIHKFPFSFYRSSEYISVNTVPYYVYTQVPLFCPQVFRVHHCQHSASLCVYTSSPFLSTDRQSTSLSTQCLTMCIHKFPFLSTGLQSTSLSTHCLTMCTHKFPFSFYRSSEYISVNTVPHYLCVQVPLFCLQIVRVHLCNHSASLCVCTSSPFLSTDRHSTSLSTQCLTICIHKFHPSVYSW